MMARTAATAQASLWLVDFGVGTSGSESDLTPMLGQNVHLIMMRALRGG
jgi:hypothetical protein